MVYKKYIKRGGKVFGPYYYESYRDCDKVKTRFISGPKQKDKILNGINKKRNYILFCGIIVIIFIPLIFWIVNISYDSDKNLKIIHKRLEKTETGIEKIIKIIDVFITRILTRISEKITGFVTGYGYESVSIPPPSQGYGYGSASNASVNVSVPVCIANWLCSSWSNCINGVQTRTCKDANKCGSDSGKPSESQACVVSGEEGFSGPPVTSPAGGGECVAELECEEWSECKPIYNLDEISENAVFLRGEKTRFCEDKKNCIVSLVEKTGCDTKIPIIARKIKRCFKDYIEIYNLNRTLIFRLELTKEGHYKLNIQMMFNEFEFCPYCYDGIKNYDEDEIDCVYGGKNSCPICVQSVV